MRPFLIVQASSSDRFSKQQPLSPSPVYSFSTTLQSSDSSHFDPRLFMRLDHIADHKKSAIAFTDIPTHYTDCA